MDTTAVVDVAHDARQLHAFAQVVDGPHVAVELEELDRSPRVTSRLVQLLQDILQRRHSHGGGDVLLRLYLQPQLLVGDEF